MNDTLYDKFEEIAAPDEPLDNLIISKAYPKELGKKLNPCNNPVIEFFELNGSTIARINATLDFKECYFFSSYPKVLNSTQCVSVANSIITADAEWVAEIEASNTAAL